MAGRADFGDNLDNSGQLLKGAPPKPGGGWETDGKRWKAAGMPERGHSVRVPTDETRKERGREIYIENPGGPRSIPVAVVIGAVVMAAFAVVVVGMMIAMRIRVVFQRPGGKGPCRGIRRALDTGVEFDSRIGQRHPGAHADAAADQSVHFGRVQETGQRAVAAAVGVDDLFSHDGSILGIVQLELRGMPEMLEHFSVFVSDCDSH